MEKVKSKDGTVISFRKSGSGIPLILVHGTTADHTRWNPLLPQFEKHFTVYAVDRRGRGESGDSPGYNVMREAEDIAAVAESFNEPVCFLGHSFGAICCLEESLLTDNIKKMILYEPPLPVGATTYPPDVPARMQTLIDNGNKDGAVETFFREVVKMPEKEFSLLKKLPVYKTRVQLAPTIPRELTIDNHYNFNPGKFTNLRIPALILLGGDSPQIFRKAAEAVNSALAGSSITVLPHQQHAAMDTNPPLFMKEVLNFLLD